MLSFLSPLFLAGAAAAAVPIVLHLLKREPEPRVRFAAVRLLKNAPVELTEKRRLRELLLLALRVAALVLLALAFARPFFASGGAVRASGVTIVAIDTSYSMSAPGRMDHAKQLAGDAVAHAPAGDLVGVLTFDDAANVLARPSADRALARSAVAAAASGFGATRYRAGLNAAAQAIGTLGGTIVVVTDLQAGGWDVGDRAAIPRDVKVEIVDVGAPPDNLAVAAVRAAGDRILATIRNSGSRARTTHVRLLLDNSPASETDASIPPNGVVDVPFGGVAKATTAAVSIDDRDGLQADNVRYALLGGGRRTLLVVSSTGDLSSDAFYVLQALRAGGSGGDGFEVTGTSAAKLSTWDETRLRTVAAVVLVSTRGLERRGREALAAYVRAGGGVLIAAGPDVDGQVAGDLLGDQTPLRIGSVDEPKPVERALAPADVRHPVFQPFATSAATLGLVTFHRVSRVGGTGCQSIARFTTGETALLDCPAGEGRALILASDLNNRWNDFPLHATYVPFLHEAVRYLAGARAEAAEYLVGDVPAGVAPRPGIVTLPARAAGGDARRVAVNVDPREGDPSRLSVDEFQAAVTRLKDAGASEARVEARQQEDRQHLWQYALVLMLAALATEGVVASRTA